MDAGRAWHEAIAELKQLHPEKADLIQAYWDRWPEMLGEVDLDVAQMIRDVRDAGLRVYAISNWSAETFSIAQGDRAGAVAVRRPRNFRRGAANQTGSRKFFLLACRRFGVSPGEAFFVDDFPENVEAARTVGMTALQFTGAADLRQALEKAVGCSPRLRRLWPPTDGKRCALRSHRCRRAPNWRPP